MLTVAEATGIARARSVIDPKTGCWLWTGSLRSGGYPSIFRAPMGSTNLCRLILGLVPRDPESALHRCDVRRCVNPSHLFRGTPRDNVDDMLRKGRYVSGQAKKTHCRHGHEFTPENTRFETWNGVRHRACRTCKREQIRRARERRGQTGSRTA